MQLAENTGLRAPSICIICETVPDGENVVDTLYDLTTGTYSPYEGRKFVCERCVDTMAKLFGFEKGEAVKKAIADREAAEYALLQVKGRVKEFAEDLSSVAELPGPEPTAPPKPKAKPKKVEVEIKGDASKVKEDK